MRKSVIIASIFSLYLGFPLADAGVAHAGELFNPRQTGNQYRPRSNTPLGGVRFRRAARSSAALGRTNVLGNGSFFDFTRGQTQVSTGRLVRVGLSPNERRNARANNCGYTPDQVRRIIRAGGRAALANCAQDATRQILVTRGRNAASRNAFERRRIAKMQAMANYEAELAKWEADIEKKRALAREKQSRALAREKRRKGRAHAAAKRKQGPRAPGRSLVQPQWKTNLAAKKAPKKAGAKSTEAFAERNKPQQEPSLWQRIKNFLLS